MKIVLNIFTFQVTLFAIYFNCLTNALQRCYICEFDLLATKYLTPKDTIDPRGCYSPDIDKLLIQASKTATLCTWDIVLEPFETFQHYRESKKSPVLKKWRLAPAGLPSKMNFAKDQVPNTCKVMDVIYIAMGKGKDGKPNKAKVFRCFCAAEACNKTPPLCKWLRKADPSVSNPVGCVEDDKFPSDKEPKYFEGFVYNRLEGEEVPTSDSTAAPVEAAEQSSADSEIANGGERTCDDEIDEIVSGILEIQSLLKDEL